MRRIHFMLGKNPMSHPTGDVVMTRLIMSIAREAYSVSAVALDAANDSSHTRDGLTLLPKPDFSALRLARLARIGRSLIHTRFDTSELRAHLATHEADIFVAEHSYMAESFLRARYADAATHLAVNTHVPESLVLRGTHGAWIAPEAWRTRRDELRVAGMARSVASFDAHEAAEYARVVNNSIYLSLTLPPRQQAHPELASPSLAFIGDMGWAPNRSALNTLLSSWGRIRGRVPSAELKLIGKGTQSLPRLPAGVRALGFVPDLDMELSGSRGLVAPITVGGGVRVKILEAAAVGVPVIGTREGIGSLDQVLPLTVSETPDQLIERAVLLLLDPRAAAEEGSALYESNRSLWTSGEHHRTVERFFA